MTHQFLIPENCKCHLTWKMVADVTKLRIPRWGGSSGLSKWALHKPTRVFIKRNAEDDLTQGEEEEAMWP